MANVIIQELIVQADEADSLGKVKKALKDIKGAMIAIGDESSEDFKKLSAAAAELKDKVEDANAAIDRTNPDKFNGLASAAKIAATGIQLTTGAMALFGDESEDVQKALLKVQAAMAFAEGLQNVKELQKDFAKLADTIKANPIFAVAAVLIAIGAAAYKMYQNYKEANSEATKLKNIAEQIKFITEQQAISGENELKIMQAQGANAFEMHEQEKKILAIKIKNAEAQYASAKAAYEEARNQDSIYESVLKLEIAALKKVGLDKQAIAVENELKKNQNERYGEAAKLLVDSYNQIQALKTEELVSDAKYNKILVDESKKASDEKVKAAEDEAARIAALREENRRQSTEKDLLELQDYQDKQRQFLEDNIISTEEYNRRITESDQAYRNKKKAEEDQIWIDAQEQAQKELEVHQENLDKEYEQLKASNKKKADDEKSAADLKKQLNSTLISETANMFGALSSFSKKNAELQKGFAIGQTTINTYQGVSKALAAYPPPFSFLAAAAALAAGLSQVKNIIGTKEDGGSGAGGGGVGSPPNLSAINTAPQGVQPSTQLDENGNRIAPQNNQPQVIRAYMVESQATGVINNVAMTEQAMRFE